MNSPRFLPPRLIPLLALVLLAAALLDLNFLPDSPKSESIYLALLHAPFFFWSLAGFEFLGGAWRNLPGRMDYLPAYTAWSLAVAIGFPLVFRFR